MGINKFNIKKVSVSIILCGFLVFAGLQQWSTFEKYSLQFETPLSYTQQTFGKDFITLYGKRFTEVKQFLNETNKIGYYSENNQNMPTFYLHYVLSQYYLTPTLLEKNENTDTILYNLYDSYRIDPENYHLKNGWQVIKDFNNGFILISRKK
jgi:hypothetical protein